MGTELRKFSAALLRDEVDERAFRKFGLQDRGRLQALISTLELSADSDEDALFLEAALSSSRPGTALEGYRDLARDSSLAIDRNSKSARRLLRVIGCSDYLARRLQNFPEMARPLLLPEIPDSTVAASIRQLLDEEDNLDRIGIGLRRIRYAEMLRITAMDLDGAPVQETAALISTLADLSLSAGLEALDPGEESELCAIAMGKLGGHEVNYSSDIDLIFVYRGGEPYDPALHERCSRKVATLRALLSDVTDEGYVFRVDLELRPEGRAGPLASSIPALLDWYELRGQEWERVAWVRARACAGDLSLGQKIIKELRPFVYPKLRSFEVVQEILHLKMRIEEEAVKRERDVKRCSGGIREAEFFVQAFQLLYGGADPQIRSTNTADALSALVQKEILSEALAHSLLESYRFLRSVEHRIQMEGDRQTHRIPEDQEGLLRLARRMDYDDIDGEDAIKRLQRDLQQARNRIRGPFETLLEESNSDPSSGLSSWGQACRTNEGFVSAIANAAPEALVDTVRPVAERLAEHVFDRYPEEARSLSYCPEAARTLALFLAGDQDLSTHLTRRPWLLRAFRAKAVRIEEAEAELQASTQDLDDIEGVLDALRLTRRDAFVSIGAAQIAGVLAQGQVEQALTETAEAILRRTVTLACRHVQHKTGVPIGPEGAIPLTTLGCGKLGSREMSYHSDLDLVFVYGGEGETEGGSKQIGSQEHFVKVAQRVISGLVTPTGAGYAYQIDTRLRPSGNAGMLVVNYDAFQKYHQTEAQTWEAQALLRARPVGGNLDFGNRLLALKKEILFGNPPRPGLSYEIRQMRDRMESELSSTDDNCLDIKLAAGGIVDAEFLAQFLALRWGHERPQLRLPRTAEVLRYAGKAGLAPNIESALKAYLLLRRVEGLHRLFLGRADSKIRLDSRAALAVIQILNWNDSTEFEERIRDAMADLRQGFDRLVC